MVRTLEQAAGIQFQNHGVPVDPAVIIQQLIAAHSAWPTPLHPNPSHKENVLIGNEEATRKSAE